MVDEKILCHKFANGVLLPTVSLGTWQLKANEPSTTSAIRTALNCGYRAIDTAWIYGNEPTIGPLVSQLDIESRTQVSTKEIRPCADAIVVGAQQFKESFALPHGPPKDNREIFVTSKVWIKFFSKDGVASQVAEHCKNFDRDSVDLMLLHWPGKHTAHPEGYTVNDMKADQWPVRQECWLALEQHYHAGKIRAIGVSNYLTKHMSQLLSWISERKANGDDKAMYPMVNQIELSVFLQPPEDLEVLCKKHSILITGYSTMGGGAAVKRNLADPELRKIADKYGVENSDIMLRWAMQRGYTILPKSKTPERVCSNLHTILSFSLSDEDMALLNAMNKGERNLPSPNDIN